MFSVYRAPWNDLLAYLRVFFHVLGHVSWDHLFGNVMYILVLGPILEEKYGSFNLTFAFLFTAFVIGLIHLLFFPGTVLLGASGEVFMMILLASFGGSKDKTLPLTFLLVAFLFLGQQLIQIFQHDQVAQMAHIVGGVIGALFGFLLQYKKANSSSAL